MASIWWRLSVARRQLSTQLVSYSSHRRMTHRSPFTAIYGELVFPTVAAAERLSEILQISPVKTDMCDCLHIPANQPHQIIKAINAHLRDQPNAGDGTQDRDYNC